MLNKPISVFIPSGAGAPGFGGIFHCLKHNANIIIHAGDQNENSYGFGLADFSVQVPASNHVEYIPFLLQYCTKHSIDFILPITTRELEPLSENSEVFQKMGINVIVSKLEGLRIANNKYTVLKHALELNIPVPQFRQALNFQELNDYCLKRFEEGETVQCFKPIMGNGSRGFGVVSKAINTGFLDQKSAWMPLTLAEWKKRMGMDAFITPMLVSDFMDGPEYSVDVLVSRNKTQYCIPRKREKMIGGISVTGTIEHNEELISLTKKLVESLNLNGPIGVQWKYDSQGIPKLLEINPRLQGTTSACLLAGVNIPLETINSELFNDFIPLDRINWGTAFTRYWMDIAPIKKLK
jgi:carbamoyl-phosphate synthase large subunit